MVWLRREEQIIRQAQEEEERQCGNAYIKKEQAYKRYEAHGGYGGNDWREYVDADKVCQEMYAIHLAQQDRLREIGKEIGKLGGNVG